MKKFALIILLSIGCTMAQDVDPQKLVSDSYEKTKLVGSEATSTLSIFDGKGNERVREIATITKSVNNGKDEKRLVRFLAPADVKGTGLLTFDYEDKDDDMWLFMPALRKTRRIVSSEKAKSFMGSEFAYADMTPPILEEFDFVLEGEKEVNGELCWKVSQTPKDDDIAEENGFSKRIAFIAKSDNVIRKAIYYDLDEDLLKELTIYEIKKVDEKRDKYRMMHMEMVNIQNDRKSVMKVTNVMLNENVKDDYFTTRYLERQ